MISAPDWLFRAAEIVTLFVIACGLIQILFYIVQLLFAALALHRRPAYASTSAMWDRFGDIAPSIAIVAPAYNEELTIIESVEALLALHYPDFEVIVVNDGSKDATLQTMIDHYSMRPVARYHDRALAHQPIRGLYAAPDRPRLFLVDKQGKIAAVWPKVSVKGHVAKVAEKLAELNAR